MIQFKNGDRIIVRKSDKKSYRNVIGVHGTVVVQGNYDELRVTLDYKKNPLSTGGYYYFKASELMLEKRTNMTNYNIVSVKLIDSKSQKIYSFKGFEDYHQHDIVLCHTVQGNVLGEVALVSMRYNFVPTQEIICQCDFTNYENRKVEAARIAAEEKCRLQREKEVEDARKNEHILFVVLQDDQDKTDDGVRLQGQAWKDMKDKLQVIDYDRCANGHIKGMYVSKSNRHYYHWLSDDEIKGWC